MVKITDVLGAFVEAQMLAAEWEQEFQAQWLGPLAMAERVQQFLSQPAPMQSPELAQMAGHAQRMRRMAGLESGTAGTGETVPVFPHRAAARLRTSMPGGPHAQAT